MVIPNRGGGSAGGDHTLLGFFQCSKTSCLALSRPKTNFVFIKKSQFYTNFNICDYIDLASLTLFLETGYACLLHFLGKFHQKHYPHRPIMHYHQLLRKGVKKKSAEKNKPAAQAAGADPSRCSFTNTQSSPIQQNRRNS